MARIDRRAYAEMFGPTVGDKVRLGDTELFIAVEKDFTIYGEEVKFGGGKVIRDGMGQSQVTNTTAADTVITNATILDYWGVVKATFQLGLHVLKATKRVIGPSATLSEPNRLTSKRRHIMPRLLAGCQ